MPKQEPIAVHTVNGLKVNQWPDNSLFSFKQEIITGSNDQLEGALSLDLGNRYLELTVKVTGQKGWQSFTINSGDLLTALLDSLPLINEPCTSKSSPSSTTKTPRSKSSTE